MDFPENELTAPLSALLQYWRSKRHGRLMPSRFDIDPVEMQQFLPHVALIDVEGKGGEAQGERFRVRLVGPDIGAHFGISPTGYCLDELAPDATAQLVLEACETAMRRRAPFTRSTAGRSGADKSAATQHVVAVPLGTEGGNVEMLLLGVATRLSG